MEGCLRSIVIDCSQRCICINKEFHGNNERNRYYRVVERSGTIGWPSIGNLSELSMTHAAISVYGIQFEGALE